MSSSRRHDFDDEYAKSRFELKIPKRLIFRLIVTFQFRTTRDNRYGGEARLQFAVLAFKGARNWDHLHDIKNPCSFNNAVKSSQSLESCGSIHKLGLARLHKYIRKLLEEVNQLNDCNWQM